MCTLQHIKSTHDHEHDYSLLEIKCYEVCTCKFSAQLCLTGHDIYSTVL